MDPKVLLVYPPNQLMGEEIPRPDGSLGLLYLAGALRKESVEVTLLDASVGAAKDPLEDTFFRMVKQPNGLVRIGMSPEQIREFIGWGGFNIVGINSNFTPQTKMALEVAAAAKSVNSETLVIAGGVNARGLPLRMLETGLIDLICTTEGERVIVEIVRAWKPGKIPAEIPGTVLLRQGKMVFNHPTPGTISTNLDELPFPAWDLLPFEKYETISAPHADTSVRQLGRYAPMMTSRGCPFRCEFCHISTEKEDADTPSGNIGSLRLKSVERVVAELEMLKSLGVRHIYIEDDSFLAKFKRVKEILRRAVGMGFTLANVNGVNLVHFMVKGKGRLEIDREYLELLKSAGFSTIVFPVESASQRMLNQYATGKLDHSKMDVVELVRVAREVGITCPVNMMVGFPNETEEEILESIELGKRLVEAGAHYCTLFIPIPFPGSQLYDQAIQGGHLDPDFSPDIMNWKRPVMRNTVVPPERLLELRDWGWVYMNRPEYVTGRLASNMASRIAQ